jgi:Tfp pilus assembly protein PilE
MENSLLKKRKSFSSIEITLMIVSALIVGVLLTAVFAAYESLTEATATEFSVESSLIK